MNHSELIEIGKKWLLNKGCSVVITDLSSCAYERPDVIGFSSGSSIKIECKTSKSDFKNDKNKISRRHDELEMGNYRYYLTIKGLINKEDIPNNWGLLEVNGKIINKVIEAKSQNKNFIQEQMILVSTIRRLGLETDKEKVCSIKIYNHKTKNNATLSINQNEGCICRDCGKYYKVDLIVDDKLWEKITLKNDRLLCGKCIMRKIEEINNYDAYRLEKI